MSGGVITNVRLVKCLKCNRVLPELINVPVYRCGCCGVVLQAKSRKAKIVETRSVPCEDLGSPHQKGNHIPCVTEVLAADDGNSRRNEHQESGSHLKEPSKDEVHLAGARKILVGTDPFKRTSYELDHHTGDIPSYISGSDIEKHPFSRKNTQNVECQSQEVVQGSLPADCAYEIASTFSSPLSEELQSFGGKSSSPKEDDSGYGSSYSDVIQTLPIIKTKHSNTSSPSLYDSVNRANELGGTSAFLPISDELNGTRSGYGYEGSISSYEDQYDQIYMETFRDVNYPENVGERNFNANQVSNIAAMQKQAQEFFSEKNHKTIHESSWSPVESDERMRRQIRNQMGFEAEIYPSESEAPFTSKAYANDGFSSDCWDCIRSESSIYSADKLLYTEKKRVELLKMVHELQAELSRLPSGNGNVDRRNISHFENECPNITYAENLWMKLIFNQTIQGEVRNRRHQDGYYCQHRLRLHDRRLMERYVKASLANSSIATDHLRSNEMKTIHARENQLRVKQQIRPTAGGAPFIACYQCWNMLQLPVNSFIFNRRFHKLKCGSCSTILRYSLEERHIRSLETSSTRRTFNIEDYSLESSAPKPRTGSPLHRLMGYTSISEVFRGPGKGTSK